MTDRLRENANGLFATVIGYLAEIHGVIVVNPTDAMPDVIYSALLSERDRALEEAVEKFDENVVGSKTAKNNVVALIRSLKSK